MVIDNLKRNRPVFDLEKLSKKLVAAAKQKNKSSLQSFTPLQSSLVPNLDPPPLPATTLHQQQQQHNTMPKKQSIKNQIRNIKRFLNRKGAELDESIKTDQNRKLKALEAQVQDNHKKEKVKKLAIKYHKVKFFEKKKVLRKIKKFTKALVAMDDSSDSAGKKKMTKDLEAAKDMLLYIEYFPKESKYVSLFVEDEDLEREERSAKLRKSLLELAKKRKAEEELAASKKASTTHLRDYDDDEVHGGEVEDGDTFFLQKTK